MRLALSAALLLTGLSAAAADTGKDPSGTWLTGDGRAKIRIDRCGAGQKLVCGKVVWLKTPTFDNGAPRTDLKNPDPKKRARPVIGLQLIEGLKPDDAKFTGELYTTSRKARCTRSVWNARAPRSCRSRAACSRCCADRRPGRGCRT